MSNYFIFKNENGKMIKTSYKFPSKKEEDEYISICEEWCGGTPLDVIWSKETKPYQRILKERKENEHT